MCHHYHPLEGNVGKVWCCGVKMREAFERSTTTRPSKEDAGDVVAWSIGIGDVK